MESVVSYARRGFAEHVPGPSWARKEARETECREDKVSTRFVLERAREEARNLLTRRGAPSMASGVNFVAIRVMMEAWPTTQGNGWWGRRGQHEAAK